MNLFRFASFNLGLGFPVFSLADCASRGQAASFSLVLGFPVFSLAACASRGQAAAFVLRLRFLFFMIRRDRPTNLRGPCSGGRPAPRRFYNPLRISVLWLLPYAASRLYYFFVYCNILVKYFNHILQLFCNYFEIIKNLRTAAQILPVNLIKTPVSKPTAGRFDGGVFIRL